MPNTDRPIASCRETQNHLRANKTTSRNKINSGNSYPQVQQHRLKNPKNVILGHLNVNSLRSKIEAVEELMRNNIDISLFSETKLDETFPNQQFKISGYKMFRRDRNKHGGGIMFYINENIPCKTVNVEGLPDDCEVTLIELSIKSRKWLCIGLYKPPSQNEKYFLDNLSFALTKMSCEYENVMLIGDFNLTVENKNLEVFMNAFDLECLIKKPTCFQSTSPSCIDLILTNKKEFFKNSNVFEVGISDHHSLIVTALRSQLVKGNAKTKLYRDYNSFDIKLFKEDLDKNLKSNNTVNFSDFQNTFTTVFHKHAPIKKKILRFDNNSFMPKALRKTTMRRSKLKKQKKGQMYIGQIKKKTDFLCHATSEN